MDATLVWNKIHTSPQHNDGVVEPLHIYGCIEAFYMTPFGLFADCMPRAITKTHSYNVVFTDKSLDCIHDHGLRLLFGQVVSYECSANTKLQ